MSLYYLTLDGLTGDICPIGYYCPAASAQPIPCPDTTYMNHTGASICYDCPQGYRCTDGVMADPCPQGYYCPPSTGLAVTACPVGEFVFLLYLKYNIKFE